MELASSHPSGLWIFGILVNPCINSKQCFSETQCEGKKVTSNTVTMFLIKQATFNTANITTEFANFVENSIRMAVAKGTVNMKAAAYRCP